MSRNLGSFPSEPIDEKTGTNLTLMYQYLKLNKKNIYSAEKRRRGLFRAMRIVRLTLMSFEACFTAVDLEAAGTHEQLLPAFMIGAPYMIIQVAQIFGPEIQTRL